MATLTVGNENSTTVQLFYQDRGSGSPIVLVHGYPLASESWERQVPLLLAEGHRVITFDRRSCGRSSQPSAGHDWDTLACDINILMTTLDLRGAVLAAHSSGTGDVMRYLRLFGSRRVNRVALLAPIGTCRHLGTREDDCVSGPDDRYVRLAKTMADYYNVDLLLGTRVSEEMVRHSWTSAALSAPLIADRSTSRMTDFLADIASIDVPALVAFAADDRIMSYDEDDYRAYDGFPILKTVTIRDAPHGFLWTHATEVNAALLEFVDG